MSFDWKIIANKTTNLGAGITLLSALKTARIFQDQNELIEIVNKQDNEVYCKIENGKTFFRKEQK